MTSDFLQRFELRFILKTAGFPKTKLDDAERVIIRAVRIARRHRKKRPDHYFCPILKQWMPYRVVKKARGRPSEKPLRYLIICALFRAWRIGFSDFPVINNRGFNPTPFVIMVQAIFTAEGYANVEDNLDFYRSYCKRMLRIYERRGSIFRVLI
ncbi:hypothetical protein GQ367_04505 [Polynucleobacter sp. MWH-CaK5]|jgi:hypothetical protein|uniref:hypothetical protein n=1 Tax=Polynucleobacter sp. MWH-CaK5 TaxID=2689107 RepID=UPI001BFEB301|nr:hypothetical protein [Polynucleobacter sp. MWH-CaK5]QWD88180.1 hypothetical protein GQ367_04505 [Polynucleobacter sp. MWH-CaK5]